MLAVVIGMAWVLVQVGGILTTDPGGARQPESTAAPQAQTSPASADGPVQVALSTATDACDPQKVRVTPTVRPDQTARRAVQVGLVISTTAEQSCTLQPDDADLVAIISANDTPIWDSTLCPLSLLTEPVALSPTWATFEVTTWTGRVSGSNCSTAQPWAAAGRYTVEVGTLGGEPGKTTFVLEAAKS